jgi:hypothetical protein
MRYLSRSTAIPPTFNRYAGSRRSYLKIAKNGAAIASLTDWRSLAGPKDPSHWAEGRGAMEVARAWLDGAAQGPPPEIAALLRSSTDFQNLVIDEVEPDARLTFDTRKGELGNADLVFVGHDSAGSVVGSVEARSDEPFGPRVSDVLDMALERAVSNPRSVGIDGVVELIRGLVPPKAPDTVSIGDLRYRLLTGIAGVLAVAANRNAERAIFIIHVFETDRTSASELAANAKDASEFAHRLSSGSVQRLDDGVLHGPIQVRGEALAARPAALYIGRVTRRLSDPKP